MTLLGAGSMPAAGIVNPTIDVAGSFQQGRQDAAVNTANDINSAATQLEVLATGMSYALDQGVAGPVNPDKLGEVLASFEASGMPTQMLDALRANPEMARVILKGSARAVAAAHDEQKFPLEMAKLEQEIAALANKNNAAPETFRDLTPDEVKQRGLPAGSYQEGADGKLYQVGGGGQTINVGDNGQRIGTVPPGMAVVEDATNPSGFRLEPIPGSQAYNDQIAAAEAGVVKEDRQNLKADIVVQDADRALQQIADDPFWTTGLGAQLTGWAGGSPAKNVEKLISTVKANAGFEELQAMRESSPTGGALGNVTEKEIAYLQATIGNLEQDQSSDQLIDNLKRVKNAYLDIIHGEDHGPPREELSFDAPEDKGGSEKGATKTIGGKTYINGGGGPDDWYEAD
jgi:hypothetical protein